MEVYDITNRTSPVKIIDIPNAGGGLACNSKAVFVSQSGEGLLIIDANNFASTRLKWGTWRISGMSLVGDTLYLSFDSNIANTIKALDVTNPLSPVEIMSIKTKSVGATGVYASDGILAGVTYWNTLDFYDPASGTYLSSYGLGSGLNSVARKGNYLFLCGRPYFDIIDISAVLTQTGPATLIKRVTIDAINTGIISNIIINDLLIITRHDLEAEIFDIMDIANPVLIGRYNYKQIIGGYPTDLSVIDSTHFAIACHYRGAAIVNITDPTTPTTDAKFTSYGRSFACTSKDNIVYAIDDMGLRTIDFSGVPKQLAFLDFAARGSRSIAMDMEKNIVYLPTTWGKLKIVDVSNPAAPVLISEWKPRFYVDSVAKKGNYLFSGGLNVLDVTNPSVPVLVANVSITGAGGHILIHGNYAYITGGYLPKNMKIVDITNPLNPVYVTEIVNASMSACAYGNYLFVVADNKGIYIYDITNPASPIQISTFKSPTTKRGYGSAYYNGKVYAGLGEHIVCIDVSDPRNPTLVWDDVKLNDRTINYIDTTNGVLTIATEGIKLANLEAPLLGSIGIVSNPAGARIFIDNVDTTKTAPATIDNLQEGIHDLKLTLTGYIDWINNVNVLPGQTVNVTAQMVVQGGTTGNIFIDSVPQGAKIYLDGTDTGKTTPSTLSGVSQGTHGLKLTLSGYQDYSVNVQVTAGQTANVSAAMVPVSQNKGSINFASTPGGAEIFVDDVDQGITTPSILTDVSAGIHTYILRLSGYNDYTGTVEVFDNQTAGVSVSIVPAEGCIFFNTIPQGARIFIDNADTGQVTPALICGLSLGFHTYRLALAGYHETGGDIPLSAGQGANLSGILAPVSKEGIGIGTIMGLTLIGAGIVGVIIVTTKEKKP